MMIDGEKALESLTTTVVDKLAGSELAKLVGDPFWHARMRYFAWMWQKTQRACEKAGLKIDVANLGDRFGIKFIEAAAFEDDDRLQKCWSSLLAASLADEGGSVQDPSFISVLDGWTPKDARMFLHFYSGVYTRSSGDRARLIITSNETDDYPSSTLRSLASRSNVPKDDLSFSLSKLEHQGIVSSIGPITSLDKSYDYQVFSETPFGRRLYDVLTIIDI